MKWQEVVRNEEDYLKLLQTGMAYEWFPDLPTWKECEQILNKEKEEERNFVKSNN